MAHSKKELDMAGTERRVYDSFMREMRGYELANHDGFENSGVISLGVYFPEFSNEEMFSKVRKGYIEVVAKNGEGKKSFFTYELPPGIDRKKIVISHLDGLVEILIPKKS